MIKVMTLVTSQKMYQNCDNIDIKNTTFVLCLMFGDGHNCNFVEYTENTHIYSLITVIEKPMHKTFIMWYDIRTV